MKITTFKEWKTTYSKKAADAFKAKLDAEQIQIGKLLEINFIKAATQLADKNDYLKVDTVSQDVDLFFGADFKFTYKDTLNETMNNLSMHVDITANPEKKNMHILQEDVYTMSNQIKVSFGVKYENRFFYYNKPVLVIFLHVDPTKPLNPIFREEDMLAVFFAAQSVCRYISYEIEYSFAGEDKTGGGKRASEVVCVKPRKVGRINKDQDFR